MKKKSVKAKRAIVSCLLIALVGAAGISAYFTATDTATNKFDVQKVDVDLTEPKYDNLSEEDKKVVPNQTITKDPTVTNTGTTDSYVFLSVKVPFKNIITANLDGTRNAAADTELFTWNSSTANGAINAAKGAATGAVNTGWTLVKTNILTDSVEYIYGYGSANEMTSLAPNASTPTLFDSVTFCNAIEGQGLERSTVEIPINVYAIQDSDLKVSGNGTKVPAEVLEVYLNQDPNN